MMKISFYKWIVLLAIFAGSTTCTKNNGGADPEPPAQDEDLKLAAQNISRAVAIIDECFDKYFQNTKMFRYYNPFTGSRSSETGSVWMYTSSIQALCSSMKAMQDLKRAGNSDLYDAHFSRYSELLAKIIDGLDWYEGTYSLISFTQTKEWSVYGVNRGQSPHTAPVDGINNVYDDQEWLIKELLEAYKITGTNAYLQKAEYLSSYVIDGWDCTLKSDGTEHGGIPWGPGYYTKHSCSNGPFVSPLVELAEIYKNSTDQIEYRYIQPDKRRAAKQMNKSEYYLSYARKIFDFQKSHLFSTTDGVYYDMLGAKGTAIAYEKIDGIVYRANNQEEGPTGEYYTYNTGTMLSGAAALYRLTGESEYLNDMTFTSSSAFRYFAKESADHEGYYEYPITGFSNWFNSVLLRGWVDVSSSYKNVDLNIMSFQHNLDYAYEHNLYNNLLPSNLLQPWNVDRSKCSMEGMFEFAYAAEYADIAKYLIAKQDKKQ